MIKSKKSFLNIAFLITIAMIISLVALSMFATRTNIYATDGYSVSWDARNQGYADQSTVTDITLGEGNVISGAFSQAGGSTPPKYYATSEAVRLYAKGTLTIRVLNDSYRIDKIELVITDGTNAIIVDPDNGSFDAATNTWTGKSDEVVFTEDGTKGNRPIQSITVYYSGHSHAVSETHDRVEPTCIVDGYKTYYECDCGVFFEDADCLVEIGDATALATWKLDPEGGLLPAVGHTYTGEITYVWNNVTYFCTATRYCDFDCGEYITETVEGVYVKDTYATCTENEKGHYKATFQTDGFGVKETEENSYEVRNSKSNHPNRRIEYSWDNETHKCTASLYCNICLEKLDSETVQGVYVKDFDATCTENEKGHYKATFSTLSSEIKQTERGSYEVPESKLGHNSGMVEYDWNGNKCVAHKYCDRCNALVETKTSNAEYVKDVSATCTANEKGHYVAFDGVSGYTKQTTLMFDLEGTKLGHDFEISYTWNEDKSVCVASAHCVHDDCDIEEEASNVNNTITKENGYYVARFTNDLFTMQTVSAGEEQTDDLTKIMLIAMLCLSGLTLLMVVSVICLSVNVSKLKRNGIKTQVESVNANSTKTKQTTTQETPKKEEKQTKVAVEKTTENAIMETNDKVVEEPKPEKEAKPVEEHKKETKPVEEHKKETKPVEEPKESVVSEKKATGSKKKSKLDKIQQVLDALNSNENEDFNSTKEKIQKAKSDLAEIKSDKPNK